MCLEDLCAVHHPAEHHCGLVSSLSLFRLILYVAGWVAEGTDPEMGHRGHEAAQKQKGRGQVRLDREESCVPSSMSAGLRPLGRYEGSLGGKARFLPNQ